MSKETEQQVSVPMTEFVKQIARESGTAAAKTVIDEHAKNCGFNQLSRQFWGQPGDPGVALQVHDLKQDVQTLKEDKQTVLGSAGKIALYVVSTLAAAWAMVKAGLK